MVFSGWFVIDLLMKTMGLTIVPWNRNLKPGFVGLNRSYDAFQHFYEGELLAEATIKDSLTDPPDGNAA